MSVAGWGLASPWGLLWALMVMPILAMHVMRPRRTQAVVSALLLWHKVATPVSAARPWQRLVPSWLLIAQLLAALLLAVIAADPVRETDEIVAEHTIFVIDASASMRSLDGTPTRLDSAISRATELRDQIPAGGQASIVVAGERARAVLTQSDDEAAFTSALAGIRPSFGSADFAGAFALAAGLDTNERPSRAILLSDGGVSAADLRLAPTGTHYEKVGTSATNRGVTQLSVEAAPGGLVARVSVVHFGGPEATQTLRIDVDGKTIDQQEITLGAGAVENLTFSLPVGERVEVFLEGEDVLSLDNRAVATVARRPEVNIHWAGPSNQFLAATFEAMPGVSITRTDAAPTTVGEGIDLLVVDRVALAAEPTVPVLAIALPGGLGDIVATGIAERPALTLVRSDIATVRDLDLSQVLIAEAQVVTIPSSAEVLLGAENAPLLTRTELAEVSAAYFSFAFDQSTLPLQAAFPVLIDRLVTELTNSVAPPSKLTVGDDLTIDARLDATVTSPLGTTVSIAAGGARPAADQIGFWLIEQPTLVDSVIAVNADSAESSVAPIADLPIDTAFTTEAGSTLRGTTPFVRPLLAVLLVLLIAEWLLARRRVGVGPRQWRAARVMRLVTAGLILAALIGPSITRNSQRLATVFLIDASDSIGFDGRLEASRYVSDALETRADDDSVGVVVFGHNARLETLVDNDPNFDGVTIEVDRTGTDLSAALRLGVAALPTDARRRLVLISDGRATTGNVAEEISRLADEGVPVDVVVIEPTSGTDLAVVGVDAPPLARTGERVEITGRIFASAPVEATVNLRANGAIIDSRSVALAAGDNTVTFTQIASGEAVLRYQISVDGPGDVVPDNNVGFVAVPVVGPEKVLLVEGRAGDAETMASALSAVGIEYDLTSPAEFPPIDEVAQFASIVLVDVDRRDLSERNIVTLATAVRDLGKGLLVTGGDSSFALGGYRESDLEDLLPVLSEITDPLRRQTVAEVLAIDTSGSMGACHCSPTGENGLGGGNRIGGGVNKTAIARNAASLAISALSATDEIGVLSMDAQDRWVIDLQASPDQLTIDAGLSQLVPDGPTFVDTGLLTAAEALRTSQASLKHIIFFSDGFTEPGALDELARQAADLLAEGITVSVVATGEGAAEQLRPIAEAGGGRFYPGTNLDEIPELIVQEAVLASRDFVNEGDFLPIITSSSPVVENLTATPPLLGYVASTAKPTATVHLRVGPEEDPLLTSWQIGLGKVFTWASDSGTGWYQPWSSWEGSPDFWSGIIKDTFPTASDGAAVESRIVDGQLELQITAASPWAQDATATARVAGPDGSSAEVTLERISGTTFATVVAVEEAGTYAIGASVTEADAIAWSGIGLTNRSYPAEYTPSPVQTEALARIADTTGGRVEPAVDEIFSSAGTIAGATRIDLRQWLILAALLLWPIAVAVSRLTWRRGKIAAGPEATKSTVARLLDRVPRMDTPASPSSQQSPPPPTPTTAAPASDEVHPPRGTASSTAADLHRAPQNDPSSPTTGNSPQPSREDASSTTTGAGTPSPSTTGGSASVEGDPDSAGSDGSTGDATLGRLLANKRKKRRNN